MCSIGEFMKNKYFYTSILLAILCGMLAGACHLHSVEQHKAKGDTFASLVSHSPTETTKAVYEPITEPKVVYARNDDIVISRLIDDGIPTEVKKAAEKWGNHYGICPELIEALAYQESRFIPDIVSADGSCIGLCQVNPSCHKARMEKLGVTDLTDIDGNIAVATDYLEELFEQYEGDVDILLMAYNGDSSYKNGHISRYAAEILERSEDYERLHGKK